MTEEVIAAIKDRTSERPIPTAWRPALRRVVDAFVRGDYAVVDGGDDIESISEETALHIQSYVRDYGATLKSLPDETWDSSVCIWMGDHWDLLLDLYTEEEGPSDLVLSARVTDSENGFRFSIHMVYVP